MGRDLVIIEEGHLPSVALLPCRRTRSHLSGAFRCAHFFFEDVRRRRKKKEEPSRGVHVHTPVHRHN